MKWIGQHIYDLTARFRGDVTIEGDLTVNGTYTQIDTDVTTTEQWLVTNDGTGPAAIINQKGSQDIFDVQDDGTSVFYIEDGGNVGIGTTNPTHALQIEDGFTLSAIGFLGTSLKLGNYSSIGYNRIWGDGANMAYSNNNGYHKWMNQNTELMRITPAGNVGIGTTSPSQALDVFGNIKMQNNNALMSENVAGGTRSLIALGNDNILRIKGNDSEGSSNVISMVNGGNVGIGTSSPTTTLEVRKVGATADAGIRIDAGRSADFFIDRGTTSSRGVIDFLTASSRKWRVGNAASGTDDFQIFGANNNEFIIDRDSGNIGIGTTSPAYTLDVAGVINTNSNYRQGGVKILGRESSNTVLEANGVNDIIFETNNAENVRITSAGNVGIGTSSPSEKLEVDGRIKLQTTSGSLVAQEYGAGSVKLTSSATLGIEAPSNFRVNTGPSLDENFTVLSTGNVGVGTATPGHKLSISGGNAQISHTEPTLFFNDTTTGHDDWKIYADWDKFYIQQHVGDSSYSTRLMSDASGNVGIGTTTPSEKLEVAGKAIIRKSGSATAHGDTDLLVTDATAASSTAAIQILGGNAGFSNLQFSDTDSYTQGAIMYGHTDNYMAFKANAAEKMRITSAGNVGIGTATPSYKLDVDGTSDFGDTMSFGNAARGRITWGNGSINSGGVFSIIAGASQYLSFGSNGIDGRMVMDSTGNVGIGTTAPAYPLHIATDSSSYAAYIKNTNNNGGGLIVAAANGGGGTNTILSLRDKNDNSKVSVIENGNVGIGTTSPSRPLHVVNTSSQTVAIFDGGNNGAGEIAFTGAGTSGGTYVTIGAVGDDMSLSAGASEKMRITSAGNVGINTESPTSKLYVKQSNYASSSTPTGDDTLTIERNGSNYLNIIANAANYSGVLFSDDTRAIGQVLYNHNGDYMRLVTNGTEQIRITSAGNVGIGTTSPGYKLHVAGNADISGDLSGVDTLTATTLSVTNYGLASADIPNNAANTTGVAYGLNGAAGSLLTAPAQNQLLYTGQISNGVSGLFAASNNSNSVITLNRHYGNYDSQLGFSSNGNVYYRKFSGAAINTSQAWKTMAFTDSDISGNAGSVTNGVYTNTIQTITGNKTFSGLTTLGVIIPSEIALSANVTSDHNFNGTTLSGNELGTTDGTSVSQGHLVYLSTTGSWEKTDSDALATSFGMLAIQGSGDQSKQLVVNGLYNLGYDPGGDRGDPLYISGTVGLITSTAPTGTGDIVRIVGYKMHATSGLIYFNPDQTWVELT